MGVEIPDAWADEIARQRAAAILEEGASFAGLKIVRMWNGHDQWYGVQQGDDLLWESPGVEESADFEIEIAADRRRACDWAVAWIWGEK